MVRAHRSSRARPADHARFLSRVFGRARRRRPSHGRFGRRPTFDEGRSGQDEDLFGDRAARGRASKRPEGRGAIQGSFAPGSGQCGSARSAEEALQANPGAQRAGRAAPPAARAHRSERLSGAHRDPAGGCGRLSQLLEERHGARQRLESDRPARRKAGCRGRGGSARARRALRKARALARSSDQPAQAGRNRRRPAGKDRSLSIRRPPLAGAVLERPERDRRVRSTPQGRPRGRRSTGTAGGAVPQAPCVACALRAVRAGARRLRRRSSHPHLDGDGGACRPALESRCRSRRALQEGPRDRSGANRRSRFPRAPRRAEQRLAHPGGRPGKARQCEPGRHDQAGGPLEARWRLRRSHERPRRRRGSLAAGARAPTRTLPGAPRIAGLVSARWRLRQPRGAVRFPERLGGSCRSLEHGRGSIEGRCRQGRSLVPRCQGLRGPARTARARIPLL